jgi:hypothetical protein
MKGHKGEYFILGLSFILWHFLEVFTLGLAGLFVEPYYNLTFAKYYRELTGTGPVPAEVAAADPYAQDTAGTYVIDVPVDPAPVPAPEPVAQPVVDPVAEPAPPEAE